MLRDKAHTGHMVKDQEPFTPKAFPFYWVCSLPNIFVLVLGCHCFIHDKQGILCLLELTKMLHWVVYHCLPSSSSGNVNIRPPMSFHTARLWAQHMHFDTASSHLYSFRQSAHIYPHSRAPFSPCATPFPPTCHFQVLISRTECSSVVCFTFPTSVFFGPPPHQEGKSRGQRLHTFQVWTQPWRINYKLPYTSYRLQIWF